MQSIVSRANNKSVMMVAAFGFSLYVLRRVAIRQIFWHRSKSLQMGFKMPSTMKSMFLLLTSPRSGLRCSTIPKISLETEAIEVDQANLNAFLKLFNYPQSTQSQPFRIPTAFLQVWTGSLQLRLAADPTFPVSLIGSVALKVVIRQLRKVNSDKSLKFIASNRERVKLHKNNGCSMQLETFAYEGSDLVWESEFGFFQKLSSIPGDTEIEAMTPIQVDQTYESYELLLSIPVPQDAGIKMSKINQDYNPVHISKLGSRAFGFRTMIAHGVWSVNQVLAELERRNLKLLVKAERNEVSASFLKPLFVGSQVKLFLKQIKQDLEYHFIGFTLDRDGNLESKPYVVGKIVAI